MGQTLSRADSAFLKDANLNLAHSQVSVPLDDRTVKKFRELSEDFWERQEFVSGAFAQAEVLPVLTPSGEVSDEGIFETLLTEAVDCPFAKFLDDLETAFMFSLGFGRLLRVILVRVKPGSRVGPYIDDTFKGIDHAVYRMQIVKPSKKGDYHVVLRDPPEDGYTVCEDGDPELNIACLHYDGVVCEEWNDGLNDGIHALIYIQRTDPSEDVKEAVRATKEKEEREKHSKIY